ncbi:MAG: endopeptidase La [Chloroflexota bacterium]|nr:endopeptidase La [Chloroflexota bacterium]
MAEHEQVFDPGRDDRPATEQQRTTEQAGTQRAEGTPANQNASDGANPATAGRDQKPAQAVPAELPILPLKGTVVFPLTVVPLAAGQARSLRLIDDVINGDRLVGLVMQKDADQEGAGPGDTYDLGVMGVIHQMMRVPDGTVRLAIQGLERVRLLEFTQEQPYLKARVEHAPEGAEEGLEVQALVRNALDLFQRLVSLGPNLPDDLLTAAINVEEPRHLVYFIASNFRQMEPEQRQQLLELDSVRAKLEMLNGFMSRELEVLELGKKIQNNVQEEVSKTQREYFLREQLKAIQKELGETNEQEAEVSEYRRKIDEAGMPEEAEREARRELDRLSKLPPAAAEYGVIKTYLDWLTSLPWTVSTEGEIDINKTGQILDDEHYGLEKAKERILEYLAVRKLKRERTAGAQDGDEAGAELNREPILCFVGPPGVGKTSLAQSIARSLGRHLTRMSLGGVRDEAEIRGHRRTYIGALPGRIIQAIRRAGSNDPVFVLDEVDKIGADWRGDPSSALLEVLDPEQNNTFRDHYLDVSFDLSKVMFICTANQLDPIPGPLRDRMEIIQISGYTDEEKLHIARKHLIPKQLRANGLSADEVTFEDEALREIIAGYTREAGVRNLEREIGSVLRKVATAVAAGKGSPGTVTPALVREYLGRRRFFYEDIATRTAVPGVATGMVVTAVGGDLTFIEATRVPGKGQLIITGQLGDVMKESAQAALSYVRSRAGRLGIDPDFFKESDIHIHVPAGAIPKDGPSAGITMATALVSLLTDTPVREDVAMTGEITLRGQVLPIGGLKEKSLAAYRAGLRTIIFPARNEGDLDELPEEMRREVTWVPATTLDDVLRVALPGVLDRAPDGVAPERLPEPERERAPLAASGARP